MFFIYGWRIRPRTLRRGKFHCPQCQDVRRYRHERLRRWLTLFFIRVFPIGSVGEQVTCTTCRKSWQPSVLDVAKAG